MFGVVVYNPVGILRSESCSFMCRFLRVFCIFGCKKKTQTATQTRGGGRVWVFWVLKLVITGAEGETQTPRWPFTVFNIF